MTDAFSTITTRGGGDNCGAFYDECYSNKNYQIAGNTSSSGEITVAANVSHNYYANVYISDPRFRVTKNYNSSCTIGADHPGHYLIDYSDGDPYYDPDNNLVSCTDLP